MDVEPRLIPRLQPQNSMGAADQISTLPLPLLPRPPKPGTVLGKCIITSIRIVALRKTAQGIVLVKEWSSDAGSLPVGRSLEWCLQIGEEAAAEAKTSPRETQGFLVS